LKHYRGYSDYGRGWGMCNGTNPFDGNQDSSGYPCLDQLGRAPDADSDGIQDLEPIYEWNNLINGKDINFSLVWSVTASQVKENRDYYNNKQKPGYVPYAYPHPLSLIEPMINQQTTQNKVELLNKNGVVNATYNNITACANKVSAGQTCLVYEGVYNERIKTTRSGNSSNRITFKVKEGENAQMLGFWVDYSNYVTIEGFNVIGNGSCVLNSYDSGIFTRGNYTSIINNHISGVKGNAITNVWTSSVKPQYTYIANNTIVNSQIGITIGGDYGTIENNEVSDLNIYPECFVAGTDSDYIRFFGNNHTIRNNFLHGTEATKVIYPRNNTSNTGTYCNVDSDCNTGAMDRCCLASRSSACANFDHQCANNAHLDCFQTFDNTIPSTKNIIIENNYCTDFMQAVMAQSKLYNLSSNITLRNNIFFNGYMRNTTPNPTDSSNCGNMYVANSSFLNNNFINIYYGTSITNSSVNSVVRNNIYFNILGGGSIRLDDNTTQVADHNLVSVDPKFVNISNPLGADGIPFTSDDGLRLQNNSPAIDSGTYVGLPYNGNAPDIGAYEYS
jgi:hypothetical protein